MRGRGGNGTWPRARSEQRRQRTTSEAKKSPWRPTKIVATPRKVRNQFVGDVDFDDRLLGAGPELPHGFPGLIAQPAVDAALKAIEPPEFNLRLPYLFGRIGRRAGVGAWLGSMAPLPPSEAFCASCIMQPEAIAPAGRANSEIAIAATPARQKQPYIVSILYLIFASLAAVVDGGLLMPDTVAEQSAFGHTASCGVGNVSLCNATAMWIVERSIAFSPSIRSQDGIQRCPDVLFLAPWR